MSNDISPIFEGATLTTAILAAEHLGFWPYRDSLPLTARYTLGTAAIGAGVTWAALRRNDPVAAVAFWCIAGAGGALIVSAHWLRAQREQPVDNLIRRALGGQDAAIRRNPPEHNR